MERMLLWVNQLGQGHEVLDAEAFGAQVEDGVGGVESFRQERLEGIPQGLAPLVESGFHHGRPLRRRRITADCTLGGGAKAPEPTVIT